MNLGCCDPLDPVQLGENMELPLSPELLQKAASAGITTGASPSQQAYRLFPSGSNAINLGTPSYLQTTEPALNVNGNLSLLLKGAIGNYLNLVLSQDDSVVLGHGNMVSGNSSQNVTADGIVENGKLSLTIKPNGGSDIYKLALQSDGNTLKGSYNIQYPDGTIRSGTAIGILPDNSIKMQTSSNQLQQNPAMTVTSPPPTTPIGHGNSIGSTFSSSKSISMSGSSGGSMISSTSSTAF